MHKLTPHERSELRSQAHSLHPVVMISDGGVSDGVIREINTALNAHELIKIRVFSDDRDERSAVLDMVLAATGAQHVQTIGKILVVYREKQPAEKKEAPQGVRTVKIFKKGPAKGPNRGSFKRISLKGNERVTAGGLIKRAKKRQVSVKKRALD